MPFAVFQPGEEAVLCEFDVNRLLFDVFGMIMLFFVRFSQFDVNRLLFDVFGMIMLFFVRFGHNQLLKDISRQSPLQFVLSGSVHFFFVREDGVLKRRTRRFWYTGFMSH